MKTLTEPFSAFHSLFKIIWKNLLNNLSSLNDMLYSEKETKQKAESHCAT